jgi:hypothetical protein
LISVLWSTVLSKLTYLIALILSLLRCRTGVLEPEASGALELGSIMAEWGLRVLAVSCLLKQTALRLRAGAFCQELLAVWAHLQHGLSPEVTFLHYAVLSCEGLVCGCLEQILLPHPASGGKAWEGRPARGYHPLV